MNHVRKKAALALLLASAFWLLASSWLFGCTPLGEALEQLDRERDRVSPPRAPRENASCAVLGPKFL